MTEWSRAESSWETQVPTDKAWNRISRSFLVFMIPLLNRGMKTKTKGPIEREDLPGLPSMLTMRSVHENITNEWNRELSNSSNPRLYKAIWRSNRPLIILGMFCSFMQGVLSAVGRPLVLRYLVLGLQKGMGTGEAIGLVVFFGLVAFLEGWLGVVGRQLLAEDFGTHYIQCISNLMIEKVGEVDVSLLTQPSLAVIAQGKQLNAKETGGASFADLEKGDAKMVSVENDEEADKRDEEEAEDEVIPPQLVEDEDTPRRIEAEKIRKKKFSMAFGRSKSAKVQGKVTPVVAETAILGNDMVRSYENLRAASQLPMATASVIGGVTILLLTVGTSSLTGLGIMLFILTANVFISRISFHLEKKNIRLADQRLQIVSSILESVRAVKLFGWEGRFLSRVEGIRNKEVIGIAKYRMTHVSNIVMGRASPVLSSMVTLIVFALGDGAQLSMANAFVTVSVFQSLRLALIMIPLATQSLMAVTVNLARMEKYLLAKEVAPRVVISEEDPSKQAETKPSLGVLLSLTKVNLAFPSTPLEPVLRDLNLTVKRGEIVALCGSVGAGKTTLLRAALQLMNLQSGTRQLTESVGYVPQRALVIGGTIRDNVLMGRPYEEEKFTLAVKRSQLQRDIDMFPQKENAEVGERGTTLSGGQMQRLSMARALYSRPSLLVMDDPFSAVDPKVCRAMFDACVVNEAKESSRTGILVALNQLSYLPQCDRIVFLHQKRIHCDGPFQEIKKNKVFEDFVQSFTEDSTSSSIEDVPVLETIPPPAVAASEALEEPESTGDVPDITDQAKKANGMVQAESILKTEARTRGAVSMDVYWSYIQAFGPLFALFCLVMVGGGYSVMTVNDFWLSRWSAAESNRTPDTPPSSYYATIFAILSCCFAILILCGSFFISLGGVRASKKLHNEIIRKVLWAPMSWFESNPTGRVMSRFAGDIARVDLYLSLTIDNAVQLVVQLFASIVVVCVVVSVYLIPVSVVAILVFALLLRAIDRTLRETKRLSNAAMSPVLSNIAETAVGLREVAKAFGKAEYASIFNFFRKRHEISCDEYARANFFSGTLINFSFLAAHVIAFFIAIVAASLMVALKDSYDQSLLGIALTYALVIPYLSSQSAQSLTNMNMSFTSLERLLEYKHLPQEAPHALPSDPDEGQWPTKGEIVFENVQARYRPGLPLCLKGCSFTVRGGESVGIVGRTGSGKSSLIAVLFRLIEPTSGTVTIDGINLQGLGLDALRSRITIIPQEPILMSGTVRYNLDPFNDYDDNLLIESLRRVGLKNLILSDPIESKGANISAGERQLLCFARALVLKNHRIVIMDEPSSSLDMKTDETIVKLVQDELRLKRKCTILTVAHRVETIIQADRILVMRDGKVVEYDQPKKLLRKQGSEFGSLVSSLGPTASSRLLVLADTSVSNFDRVEEREEDDDSSGLGDMATV